MKVYRYKLYTNAKRGELSELIYRFGVVRNYAVKNILLAGTSASGLDIVRPAPQGEADVA